MSDVNFKYLLASLIILVLTIPVLHDHTPLNNRELLDVSFATGMLLGVLSLAGNVKEFPAGVVAAAFALTCAVIAVFSDMTLFHHLMMGAGLVFFLLVIRYSVRQVLLEGEVDLNKIIGSVCIFLLLALLWAIIYQFVEVLTPGSFSNITSADGQVEYDKFVYFSLVTLTTLGYGDITPTTPLSGVLAALEAVVGVFYIAILVATLVGDFMARKNARGDRRGM
jgi:hypothetical protein